MLVREVSDLKRNETAHVDAAAKVVALEEENARVWTLIAELRADSARYDESSPFSLSRFFVCFVPLLIFSAVFHCYWTDAPKIQFVETFRWRWWRARTQIFYRFLLLCQHDISSPA